MEAPRIAPVVREPNLPRVPGQRRGGSQGGFERAFAQGDARQERDPAADHSEQAEPPAPSRLQPHRLTVRKNQDHGDHVIDVLV